jgi:aminoglycoside phosphotransferase (APT) family kinase protein
MKRLVLDHCRSHFPGWADLAVDDVDFDDPKGFSSFTMAVRPRAEVDPPAVFYRRLEGKENAILDFEAEKRVFLTLGEAGIAARCLAYHRDYRLEAFYRGRTLRPAELFEDATLRKIAQQLHRLHHLQPTGLPQQSFFELLPDKWGRLAARVLDQKERFPEAEQPLCDELWELLTPRTFAKVRRCLPEEPLTFCHNDTYHGNIMRLDGGEIRLLDFEFSCLGYPAYDFANLFSETVMRHGQPEYPFFRVAEPDYNREDLARLIRHYVDVDQDDVGGAGGAEARFERLLRQTEQCLLLSHYVYAMAALPLALEPTGRLRFLPYAHARFAEFERQYALRFPQ